MGYLERSSGTAKVTKSEEEAGPPAHPSLLGMVRAIIATRSARHTHRVAGLFSDPAWDILLAVFEADLAQTQLSLRSLCERAAISASAGLKWIEAIEAEGLLVRGPDAPDSNRASLELSPEGRSWMIDCLSAMDERRKA